MKTMRSPGDLSFSLQPLLAAFLAVASLFAFATMADAHPGHHAESERGLQSGLSHPWMGLDHIAAMIVVGALAMMCGGRWIWGLPLAFVAAMMVGGLFGDQVGALDGMSWWVSLSVIALGLGLGMARTQVSDARISLMLVAVAGLTHGWLHGASVAADAGLSTFLLGMTIATALLHAVGLVLGKAIGRSKRPGGRSKRPGGCPQMHTSPPSVGLSDHHS